MHEFFRRITGHDNNPFDHIAERKTVSVSYKELAFTIRLGLTKHDRSLKRAAFRCPSHPAAIVDGASFHSYTEAYNGALDQFSAHLRYDHIRYDARLNPIEGTGQEARALLDFMHAVNVE